MIDIPATERCRVGAREGESLWCSSPLHRREFLSCLVLHIIGAIWFQCSGSDEHAIQPRAQRFPYTWSGSSPVPQLVTQLDKYLCEFIFPEGSASMEPSHKQSFECKRQRPEHHGGRGESRAQWERGSQRAEHHGSRQPIRQSPHPLMTVSDLDSHGTRVIWLVHFSKLRADIASRIFTEHARETFNEDRQV